MIENLTEQEKIRREKLEFLKEKNVDPFGSSYKRTDNSKTIIAKYNSYSKEELETHKFHVSVAGRMIQKRRQGKIGFINLLDKDGVLQAYISKEILGEDVYDIFIKSDIGDILGIEGYVMRTNTNELTIKCEKFTHLTKALRPLPEKFHGLQDVEEARRRRYLDLISNEEARRVAFLRPKIIRAIQRFFDNKGFVEVDTPILHPILGGAAARPFKTHHNALDMEFYLRIATELPLKRLIVGGMEAVYEIGRLFRNEGVDSTHNPEFTTIEAYLAYADMYQMMDLVEDFFKTISKEILGTTSVTFGDHTYDLSKFRRVHMVELIKEKTGVDFFNKYTFEEACLLANKHNVEVEKHYYGVGHIINAFFEKFCEEDLIEPTLVYGHPIEISPLAKKNKDDERFTDRFELFIGTTEYANAFSELNDPIDQLERFENQLKEKNMGNDEASEIDRDFVEALEYGMPPCGGIGIGIDRLIMFLSNKQSIRDILLFPHSKNKN